MTPLDWLNLLTRWTHFIAGIAWIGSSFYFIWLDQHLAKPDPPRDRVEGDIWMVHSGGFYQVERRRLGPGQVPTELHWFKWEALITWLTGLALLVIVYYATGGMYLVDANVARVGTGAAIGIGVGAILLGWIIYDAIWKSPLGRRETLASALCVALLAAFAYALTHLLSGRAAFIHVGAVLGTIMGANVWHVILPCQSKMIAATQAGEEIDWSLSAQAKRRSVHNSYMTFPVLFLMLSNHFPALYGSHASWIIVTLVFVAGASVRHVMIAKDARRHTALIPAAAALVAVAVLAAPPRRAVPAPSGNPAAAQAVPAFPIVRAVINERCIRCHSAHPADAAFPAAPLGVMFDSTDAIVRYAPRIKARAVESKTMPLGNKTGMSDAERALLGAWVDAGAPR